MKVGVIGFGKMGSAVAYRLQEAGIIVFGYDVDSRASKALEAAGIVPTFSLQELAERVDIVWLMVPAGAVVDTVIDALFPYLTQKKIVIDGGNSHFTDSLRRAEKLQHLLIPFLDCGTSGGLYGRKIGFSLMVGGDRSAYDRAESVFKALAAPGGYGYMGPSGAGHYVKMVHNGIEYALLQAYAEGFHLLKEGRYKDLDLAQVASIWLHGSVIRSWLLELCKNVFEHDPEFKNISGAVGGGSTGTWTVAEAHKQAIPVRLIEDALAIRTESQLTGGDYGTKLVALLREQFGGHDVKKTLS